MSKAIRAAPVTLLLTALSITPAQAISVWNNAAGGLYSNSANWTGGVPLAGAAVNYNLNGTYTVNVDATANHGATQFAATNANVTLNITGAGYTIPATVKIGGSSGTNTVSASGSKFDPTNLELAPTVGGSGTLSLSGPLHATAVAVGGQLTVSNNQTNETKGGVGTLNLNSGANATINTLLANNPGNGSKINFNAGTLTLMGIARSSSTAFTKVGDGTQSATLNLLNGTDPGSYSFGIFTVSNNAVLNLNSPDGSATFGNLILDSSGGTPAVLNWTAGQLGLSGTGIDISPSGLLGSNLTLAAPRTLYVGSSGTTVASGSSITISGGGLRTAALTVNPGGTVTYTSGVASVLEGDLEIGPNGITHAGGITLNNYNDTVSAWNGNLSIATGQSLTLNGGWAIAHTLSNSGTFTFNSGYIQMDGPLVIGPTGQLNGSPNLNVVTNSQISLQGDITIQPGQTVTLNGGFFIGNHIINNGTLIYHSGTVAVYSGDLVVGPTGQVQMQSTPESAANLQATGGTITFQESLTVGFNGASFNAKNYVIQGDVNLISASTFGGDSVTIASPNGTAKLTVGANGLSGINTKLLTRGNLTINGGTVYSTTMAPPTNYAYNSSVTINAGTVYGLTMQVGAASGYVDTLTMNGGSLNTTNFFAKDGAASQVVFNGGTIYIDHAEVNGSSPFVIGNGTTAAKLALWGNATSTQNFATGLTVSTSGELIGEGIITGNVTNYGKLSPGQETGRLTINGSLTNRNSLGLDVVSGTTNDKLTINGSFDAGGVISVLRNFSYQPPIGSTFDLVDFSTFIDSGYKFDFSAALLPTGRRWDFSQFATDGTLRVVAGLTADFNQDGKVDGADYLTWRKGLRAKYTSDDYNTWRTQFGLTAGSGTGMEQMSAVPEPASIVLLTIGTFAMRIRRRTIAVAGL